MKKLLVTVNVLLLMTMVSTLFGAGKTSTVQFVFATTASKSVSNPVADSSVGIKMHLSTNKTVPVGIKDNKSIDWIPAGEIWFSADITTTAPADQQYELKFYLINDTGDVLITSASPVNLASGATNKVKVVFQYPQVEFNLVKPPASHAGGVGITLHHATWSQSLGSNNDSYIDWIPVADYWFTPDETIQKEGIKLKFSYNDTEITQNDPITFLSGQQYTVNIEFETQNTKHIIAYMLTANGNNLQKVADNVDDYKFTRLILSFVDPRLKYTTGQDSFLNTGLFTNGATGGPTFENIKSHIKTIQNAGKEVFICVGGWNYSAGGDGNTVALNSADLSGTPLGSFTEPDSNYFEVEHGTPGITDTSDGGYQYFRSLLFYPLSNIWGMTAKDNWGGAPTEGCKITNAVFPVFRPKGGNEYLSRFYKNSVTKVLIKPDKSNNWCYVAEPPVLNQSQVFSSFPYPFGYPSSGLPLGLTPAIAGSDTGGYNHYQSLVHLANDLGVNGIDVDYEEFWHADWYRLDYSGNHDRNPKSKGPWVLPYTVAKYAWILYSVENNIKLINSDLLISVAAPAVGAIPIGNPNTAHNWQIWWGGNLKGLIAQMIKPLNKKNWTQIAKTPISGKDIIEKLTGGIGVMTYDLQAGLQNDPLAGTDLYNTLAGQIAFYMNSYYNLLKNNDIDVPLYIGIETQTPADPSLLFANANFMHNLPPGTHFTAGKSHGTFDVAFNVLYNYKLLQLAAYQADFIPGKDDNGSSLTKIFSERKIKTTYSFSNAKNTSYWSSNNTFKASNFGGIIIWSLFKNKPTSFQLIEGLNTYSSTNSKYLSDPNPNTKNYATPIQVMDYYSKL